MVWLRSFDRMAAQTQGFDGSWIAALMHYDANGRMSQNTRPYFVSGGTAKWTYYTFDALGRVTKATFPDSSIATYGYNGLTTTVTNDKSQVTTTLRNAQGLVASVTDANSKTTSYVYDAFGDVTKVTDPAGNYISNTFDLRGRKTASSDPDMGSWSYTYDVLSELTSQVDAKSQTTSLTYDLLGRATQRVESGLTSNWVYDTATTGVGMPASGCTGSGCTSPSNSTTFKAFTYDSLGRPSTLGITVGGTTYTYTTAYDANGRVSTVTYPSGFVAEYDYTSLGYLSTIKDHTAGTAIWTANTADAELHLTEATAGNNVVTTNAFDANTGRLLNICATSDTGSCDGNVANLSYTWDTIGNLSARADTFENYTEEFCYDALNRLTNYAIGSTCTSGSPAKTVSYDSLGDISSKSDVGTYTYGAGAAGPHAVSSIAGTVNGVVNPTFTYDANGNMTAGDGRSVTYTSFNMAASITEGTTTLGFVYGPEHERYEQCVGGCTSPTTTTIYLNGPGNEEKVISGSTVTWRDYVSANGGIVAERFNTSGTVTLLYFTGDHLGSTSVLTNSSGAVVERDSYDAFGKRRNANGTDNTACSITSSSTRGYSDQEMMDATCLINMNARIYDQTLGRFMSADTIVPDAMNGQAFNRYSYTYNNPLAFVDPTGHTTCQRDGIGGCINIQQICGTSICTGSRLSGEAWIDDAALLSADGVGFELANFDGDGGVAKGSGDGSGTVEVISVDTPPVETVDFSGGVDALGNVIDTVYGSVSYLSVPTDFFGPIGFGTGGGGSNGGGGGWLGSVWRTISAWLPHGGGGLVGGNAELGIYDPVTGTRTGAGGQYSVAVGRFWGGPSPSNIAFESGAALANFDNLIASYPTQNSTPIIAGAYAGLGGGGFLTNATNMDQVYGVFQAFTVSLPGLVSFQYAYSGNIYVASAIFGPGAYGSISYYTTNTLPPAWGPIH